MSSEESSAFRQYVSFTGTQTVVSQDCPKHLRRRLRKLIAKQTEYDEIRDTTVKASRTRPGSMNSRKA